MNQEYSLLDSTEQWIGALIIDINNATDCIFIETFRFMDDEAGRAVGEVLIKKANQGVKIKMIVDSWGTRHSKLIERMQHNNIEICFFKKLVFSLKLFTKNQERNHRKIISIDDKIAYIGSANFSKYSYKWRESILRIDNKNLSVCLKSVFMEDYKIYKKKIKLRKYYKTLKVDDFFIIREKPSILHQQTRKYFLKLITDAKKNITFTTPYFVVGTSLRKKLIKKAKEGVKVTIIIPKHSDVFFADLVRNIFLLNLARNNINICFFNKHNLHAKLMLIDNSIFSIGSTNMDYRSFRYMYEINLSGINRQIILQIHDYLQATLANCTPLDCKEWAKRRIIPRLIGWLLYPFRHLI